MLPDMTGKLYPAVHRLHTESNKHKGGSYLWQHQIRKNGN